jgi:hypothetical protein
VSADGSNVPAIAGGDLAECGFFAPAPESAIERLLIEYAELRKQIKQAATIGNGELRAAFSYFLSGNVDPDRRHGVPNVAELFEEAGAVSSLNASCWGKALSLTDVYNYMPQDRRNEWNEQIRTHKTPDFTPDSVRETLGLLLASRPKFLAERVDGIFRVLSGTHVTNRPEGFGKRMIIAGVVSDCGWTNSDRVGYINDMRCVIAKFRGRGEPMYNTSDAVVKAARRRRGEWQDVDGGAFRIRVYKCGTAHMEVHPDIAYRLNGILAYLYPTAIPSQFREPPKRKAKHVEVFDKLLPFAVIEQLIQLREPTERIQPAWPERYRHIEKARQLGYGSGSSPAQDEAERVLLAIGGVREKSYFRFDYEPQEVLDEIICTGRIPDQRAHQYYPTPTAVAVEVVRHAEIGPQHSVLEPSAGQGHIADLLPKERTTCVEISALHVSILAAKGHSAVQADFLEWAQQRKQFDRVVMNPPFSEGRARAHLSAAMTLVKPGGRLVCVLPASHRGDVCPRGWTFDWSEPLDNQFAGTSISVCILTAERMPA